MCLTHLRHINISFSKKKKKKKKKDILTYQLEVSIFMIKIDHLNWYIIVIADETPNSITNSELCFLV